MEGGLSVRCGVDGWDVGRMRKYISANYAYCNTRKMRGKKGLAGKVETSCGPLDHASAQMI